MNNCLACGHDMDEDIQCAKDFPYGDGITCKKCGTEHTTDWETNFDDDLSWWITGIKDCTD